MKLSTHYCLLVALRCAFSLSRSHAAEPAELPPLVAGKLEWNWVGNSHAEFEDDKPSGTGRWVQNFLDEMEVTPDGTVIAGCFWDEGGRCLGLYKDGRPANQAPGKNNRGGGHKGPGVGHSQHRADGGGRPDYCGERRRTDLCLRIR